MNKKISLGAAITFCIIIAAVTFSITWMISSDMFNGLISGFSQQNPTDQKINEMDSYVRANYVNDIDEDQLVNSMADGYVAGLNDPYAQYYTAEEMKSVEQGYDGVVNGIGITCTSDTSGYLAVVSVMENSPASSSGIQAGDFIIAVDGQDLKQFSFQDAAGLLEGDPGTTVNVTYRHEGVDTQVQMTRQKLVPNWVNAHLDGSVGYIQIKDFNDNANAQFQTALNDMVKQGAKSLVFDLRGNHGGSLDSVCKMLDPLLPEGVIVTETKKDGTTQTLATSDKNEIDLPMVVLTDKNTASAAELFAADLKDYGKAQQVGTTTYGKGVMQETHTLRDGSAVKITVGYFNPANGQNFNGVGLTPDFEVKLTDQELTAYNQGTLPLDQDPQYKKALEVLNTSQQSE